MLTFFLITLAVTVSAGIILLTYGQSIALHHKLGLGVLLLAASSALYIYQGSPRLIDDHLLFSEREVFDQLIKDLSTADTQAIVNELTKQVQQRLPNVAHFASTWKQLVALKIVGSDYIGALELAERARDLFPEDTELLYLMIRARQQMQNGYIDEESRILADMMIDVDPANIKARWILALAAIQEEDFAEAKEEFQEILSNVKDEEERQTLLERMRNALQTE